MPYTQEHPAAPNLGPPTSNLSRTQAAHDLGISERTLDRLIAEKELAVHRIGRRVLINRETLASFARRDHRIVV